MSNPGIRVGHFYVYSHTDHEGTRVWVCRNGLCTGSADTSCDPIDCDWGLWHDKQWRGKSDAWWRTTKRAFERAVQWAGKRTLQEQKEQMTAAIETEIAGSIAEMVAERLR